MPDRLRKTNNGGYCQIFAMDTVMEVAACGPKAEEAVQEAEGQIKALENKLSRTKADSDVSRVNHNGTTPTTGLTYGTRALLPAALEYRGRHKRRV